MISIETIRNSKPVVIVQGLHPGVIQSILDYDHLLGRTEPSIGAIVARGRKKERFFWGKSEVELPLYGTLGEVPVAVLTAATVVINVQSARNVKTQSLEALHLLPKLQLMTIFAEGTPELHALDLIQAAKEKNVLIVGPSSVGVLVPGVVKAGAIGGTMYEQLVEARIKTSGDVAVVTTSGGMVNELIRVVTGRGRGVSFAIAMGGDRYPVLDPEAAMLIAEADPQTKEIVYFGELGGVDEYKIIKLIEEGKLTKRVITYIAGVVAELFATPPQFGHAKALAQNADESASAKKLAMKKAGVIVCDRFDEIAKSLKSVPIDEVESTDAEYVDRQKAYFMSHISGEVNGNVQLLGNDLLTMVESNSVASLTLSILLGHQVTSKKLINFTDFVLRLLVDHSPNVSGAVNTMVTLEPEKIWFQAWLPAC